MPRIKYRDSDVDLMARMIRAEAEGEGNKGCFMWAMSLSIESSHPV